MVLKNIQTYIQTKIQKERSKDSDSKMPYRLEIACLKFVKAVEAMLTKLKQLSQWSSELALQVSLDPLLFIENLLKHKRKSQKDEHESNWGIGGR